MFKNKGQTGDMELVPGEFVNFERGGYSTVGMVFHIEEDDTVTIQLIDGSYLDAEIGELEQISIEEAMKQWRKQNSEN